MELSFGISGKCRFRTQKSKSKRYLVPDNVANNLGLIIIIIIIITLISVVMLPYNQSFICLLLFFSFL